MDDLKIKKEVMISSHLLARGIRSPEVIEAMRAVPREEFISPALRGHAYDDNPLPIDEGQTISQPYIVAHMTEALELTSRDRVLEIGTGSGYAAAILSRIVARVYTVELLPLLARGASAVLSRLGYDNVQILQGDGTRGWSEHAPYDAVVVTAGAPEVPAPLLGQLKIGGRLVIPVGPSQLYQTLVRVRRTGAAEYRHEYLTDVRFVPLMGEFGWKG